MCAETASGANRERKQLQKALSGLQGGEVIIVAHLYRPARSTRDIGHQIDGANE